MKYTYDDLNVERIRSRRREQRRKEDRIRKLKLMGIALSAVVIVIIILSVVLAGDNGGRIDNSSSSQFVDANATGNNQKPTDNTEHNTAENIENTTSEETSTAGRYDNYGDDLYNDGEFVVCIDPGHGSNDVGGIGEDGSYEKDDVLTLAKYLKYQLEERGITVVITRTTDVWVDLVDRPAFANNNNADLLISLHRNIYPDNESVSGFEAWINSYDSDNSYEIANMIMSNLETAGISKNRGVKKGTMDNTTDYRVNSDSSMPSVLLEMGFMSSPTDNRLFRENVKDYATAIADAINSWYQDKPY